MIGFSDRGGRAVVFADTREVSRCLQLFALVSMFDKSRKKYVEYERGGIEVGEVEGNMTNLEEKPFCAL